MELLRFPSLGGFSVRSILGFALTVLITVLLWTASVGVPAQAQDVEARWTDGNAILYDGRAYNIDTTINAQVDEIPAGATVYKSSVQGVGNDRKIMVIYFASGVDPPTAETATHLTLDYDGTSVSNPQGSKEISLSPQGEDTTVFADAHSSCSVTGIGWILCPVSVWLADGMDWLFSVLAGMIAVQPSVLGDPNNSMYVAWNVMRSIANVAFVIAFLVIIYSQLTGFGVSNYGIKKLTPRLIIAAILVNLSFVISALAIDLSNIAGYSIQQIFENIREDIFHLTGDEVDGFVTNGWGTLTAVVLGGGGLIGGVYYLATGGIFLLVPLLIGLGLTILFVVLIFAARQAIIVILVIIAPLAFVANLLPNTEKWFEKWKDLFMTMLIFFPAFSLVFGGAQLAGQLIIQNAGDKIEMLIFGMAVQIAPLVITPLILKFSGGLLGRIAQIANNPRKGVLDHSKNWAQKRAELTKNNSISTKNGFRKTLGGGGMVRYMDGRRRNLENKLEASRVEASNAYEENNRKYNGKPGDLSGGIAGRKALAEENKNAIHSHHAEHLDDLRRNKNSPLYDASMNAVKASERAEASKNRVSALYNHQRTIAGTALNASSLYLEESKMSVETTENRRQEYLSTQKSTAGTRLNRLAPVLETSKAKLETSQSNYTAMVDTMKVDGISSLSRATVEAQSAKELAEGAQIKVQSFFDDQRRTVGTELNRSTLVLENAKLSGETSKTKTAAFIAAEKLAVGSDLHLNVIRSERAKIAGQVADSEVTKMVDEFKTGKNVYTGELGTLSTSMVRDVEQLAAVTQGTQAAKNIQTQNIAEAFTAGTDRAKELLRTAQSVDPYGDVRAEASALATLDDIVNKARTANESLLEERAVSLPQPMTPKNYALKLLDDRLNGDMSQSEDLIRAAMEIAGKEAQIPIIRKMRKSHNINQDHLSAMILRNAGTMKAKGGFDLQNDMNLIHASDEMMDASIAGTLGSVAASQFKDLKNGAIVDYSRNTDTLIEHATQLANSDDPMEQKYGANGIEGIQKTYFNLTLALRDPQMVRELGDNLKPAIEMHRKIHNNPAFHKDAMKVEYKDIDPHHIDVDKPQDLGLGIKPEPKP